MHSEPENRLRRHSYGFSGRVAYVKIEYQRLTPDKLVACASVALSSTTTERRAAALNAIEEILRSGRQDRLLLLRAVSGLPPYTPRNQNVHAAAIAILGEDGTANLLAMHASRSLQKHSEDVSRNLLYHIHHTLVDSGVYFVQAARASADPQPELIAGGYDKLADLEYAVGSPQKMGDTFIGYSTALGTSTVKPGSPQVAPFLTDGFDSSELEIVPYQKWFSKEPRSAETRLADILSQTYQDSWDCPKMNHYQSASRALHSYRCSPGHDPDWWYVAIDSKSQAVAVLLLTPRHLSGILEITYMGVTVLNRQKGIGSELLRYSVHRAQEGYFPQIVLAVDSQNTPGKKLYKKHGFEFVFREAIWGVSPGKMIETCSAPSTSLKVA